MRIFVLTVGENKFSFLEKAESLYMERLLHYTKISAETVRSEPGVKNKPAGVIMAAEAARLRERIPDHSFVCVLDRQGTMVSSEDFAKQIGAWQNRSLSNVVFCIGGPAGLDPGFVRQADFVLSLSPMTFPHDLIRVLFLEQLYRAFTILRGEKYHK